MVQLARILANIVASASRSSDLEEVKESSRRAIQLDESLFAWKEGLPTDFNFEGASLDESEFITKQKIVLKLRKPLL